MTTGLRFLGSCLILAALFAHAAHAAETILVDPGPVGGSAQPLSFSVTVPSTGQVDLVFSDNKTLTFGPGDQKFSLAFLSGLGFFYDGVLLDEFGEEIPGTQFAGIANVTEPDLRLGTSTVWSGMRFNGEFFGGAYQLVWLPGPAPLPEVGDITGNKSPRADAGGPYSAVLFAPVTFDGSASVDTDGTIVQYEWDFGDESKGTSPNPTISHTYTFGSGAYVTLTVTDDSGAIASDSTTIRLGSASAPPDADAGGPYRGTAGAAVAFDGTGSTDSDGVIDSYFWTFGDRSIGSGPTPTHTYTADGKYLVTLTVTDDTDEEEQAATVAIIGTGNLPPSADAGAPVTGVVGVAVSFDGSASSDPDGTIVQYDWDYDDGSNDDIDAGPTPSHIYDTPGIYTVTLTVTDNGGTRTSSFTTADIAENNQPPVADANGPYTGNVGVAIEFDGMGSSDPDGTIATYAWDFGDRETGVGATVSHTYAEAGNYEVILTVIDDDGGLTTDRTTAAVDSDNQPPVADANGPYAGLVDVPVSFDGTASDDPDGDIATYAWDFGDGNLRSGVSPENSYDRAGVYDVTLTVTDNDGGTDVSATKAIIADGNIPPVADAGGPYRGQIGVPVTFDGSASSDPDGTITTYEWNFGDEGQGGSVTQNHTYTAAGFYHVTLTVTDDDGAANSTSTLVEIGTTSVPPLADAGGPYLGTPDSVINFDGTGSSDTDGTIVSWAWDFGDESSGDGATVQYGYNASGTYPVTLTVTDITGETDFDVTTALIADGIVAPVADAGGRYAAPPGFAVTFDGSGSSDPDGDIVSYEWNFGDEATGSGVSPSHTYTAAGSYNVILTVTDDDGVADSDTATAIIAELGPDDRLFDLAAVPNGAGGGSPLTGTLLLDLEAVSQVVALRNAATGDIPAGSEAGLSYGAVPAVALATVPDINADSGDELAVLIDGLDGVLRAELRSSGNFQTVSNVTFPPAFRPVAMRVVPDAASGPALAVLGVRDDGNVKVTVKDAATASLVSSVSFAPGFPPEFMEIVPDVSGNAVSELAVLGIDASGNIRVQLKDAATGTLIRWIQYAKAFTPLDMVVFATPQGPAIGVLQTHPDGRVRVQIKYAASGQPVGSGAVNFAQSFAPLAVVAVPDTSGNGADELGVLGVRDDDTVRVQFKDALTKAQTAQVFFAKTFPPEDIVVLDDANGDGTPELAVLGVNAAGNARVQVKDAVTGAELSTAFVP